MPTWVDHVDPAAQHGERGALGGQRGAVGVPVDAVRRAGDHGPAATSQLEAQLSGDVLAVAAGGPGADDGHRTLRDLVEPGPAEHPQREWRVQCALPCPPPHQRRPSAARATRRRRGSPAAHRAPPTRSRWAAASSRSRRARVAFSNGAGSALSRIAATAASGPTWPTSSMTGPLGGSATRLSHAHASRRRRSTTVLMPPRRSRKCSAPATSTSAGESAPRRSASVHATRSARSAPRAVIDPVASRALQRGQRSSRGPEPPAQHRSRRLGVGAPPQPVPPRQRRLAGGGDPGPDDGGGLRTGLAHRTGLRVHPDAQVHPVEQRAGQPAQVAAPRDGGAHAVGLPGRRARARVRRQHQLEARGVARHPVASRDPDLAVLHRRPQRLEGAGC